MRCFVVFVSVSIRFLPVEMVMTGMTYDLWPRKDNKIQSRCHPCVSGHFERLCLDKIFIDRRHLSKAIKIQMKVCSRYKIDLARMNMELFFSKFFFEVRHCKKELDKNESLGEMDGGTDFACSANLKVDEFFQHDGK